MFSTDPSTAHIIDFIDAPTLAFNREGQSVPTTATTEVARIFPARPPEGTELSLAAHDMFVAIVYVRRSAATEARERGMSSRCMLGNDCTNGMSGGVHHSQSDHESSSLPPC